MGRLGWNLWSGDTVEVRWHTWTRPLRKKVDDESSSPEYTMEQRMSTIWQQGEGQASLGLREGSKQRL